MASLKLEEQRLRAAIRSGATREIRAILRRMVSQLDAAGRELSTSAPPRGGHSRANAPDAPVRDGREWIRHTILARELDLDARTLWSVIERLPFARQVSDRIKLVHRARFYAALERGLTSKERH
jgi:hypothetical protein